MRVYKMFAIGTSLLCAFLVAGIQAELFYEMETGDCTICNTEYVDACDIDVEEDDSGENYLLYRLNVKKEVPESAEMHIKLLKASPGGDYNIDTGVDMYIKAVDLSEASSSVMAHLSKILNITGPIKEGKYTNKIERFPAEMLPDTFPVGSYKVTLEVLIDKMPIITMNLYVAVQ